MFEHLLSPVFKSDRPRGLKYLENKLLQLSFVNLFILSCTGILLRSIPLLSSFPLLFKNILHGHSHFAFGGWLLPVMLSLFLKNFPELAAKSAVFHWRNLSVLILVSAYGMLFRFPFRGYDSISILFSTVSIGAICYWAVLAWKGLKGGQKKTSHTFLRWAFIYAVLSGIGPFATGPLIAMGLRDTPMYFDAIYFYLHFQYNGFFAFMVLAYLYVKLEKKGTPTWGRAVFRLFNVACIPSFALSLLWTAHPVLFNWLGGIAASAQLVGLFFLVGEIRIFFRNSRPFNFLLALPVGFLCLKLFLQWLSALPVFNEWVHQRNVIVAYLHLVFLGCISMFVFFEVAASGRFGKRILTGVGFFLISFVSTEILLVLPSFSVSVPQYSRQLLIGSLFFPLGALLMVREIMKMPCRRTCRAML